MPLHSPPAAHNNDVPPSDTVRPRSLRCRFRVGHSLVLHATWWGIVVKAIDKVLGLRESDVIFEIDGISLRGLHPDKCEDCFDKLFCDGCTLSVEPHVKEFKALPSRASLKWGLFTQDLEHFANTWCIEAWIDEDRNTVALNGPATAMTMAYPEFEELLRFYEASQQNSVNCQRNQSKDQQAAHRCSKFKQWHRSKVDLNQRTQMAQDCSHTQIAEQSLHHKHFKQHTDCHEKQSGDERASQQLRQLDDRIVTAQDLQMLQDRLKEAQQFIGQDGAMGCCQLQFNHENCQQNTNNALCAVNMGMTEQCYVLLLAFALRYQAYLVAHRMIHLSICSAVVLGSQATYFV